jgi:hypothetical protein
MVVELAEERQRAQPFEVHRGIVPHGSVR